MKTYSRKSSSYLKKAFIGSNFNEMCRLCLTEVDMVLTPIFQDSQMSYQEWIRYSVDVLVEEGDGLPPNICEECLAMVEQAYVFKKKCKASDSKLREHFQLMDSIESRIIDCEFGATTDNSDQKEETSSSICEPDTVDPGGSEVTNGHVSKTDAIEVDESPKDTSKDINNLKHQKSLEKDIVKPINEDNIILNEVKRYVWKNENNGEKDAVVCEVVHYDIRNDFEDSNDGTENDESSVITSYSSAAILEEYSNNLNDSSVESISQNIQSIQSINEKEAGGNGGGGGGGSNQSKLMVFEQADGMEKLEGKIQEIRQLWDNDDESGEPMEGEDEADELDAEVNENEEEPQDQEQEQEEQEQEQEEENGEVLEENEIEAEVEEEDEAEVEDENQEGLVVDVSWEDNDNQKVDSGHSGVVEVKLEENGIIRTHKVFTTENSIQFIKMEPEKHNFECFLCNKQFKLRKEMKCHLFTAHMEAAKHFFCEICLKNFTSTNSLKRHMLVHTGVKPYGCEICGRKFSQTSILKRHRYTHGKKKPFECNFCQKSYTQKMNLLSHLRNHGIKPDTVSHRCKFCHKSFVHPSGLSRHLKQHKGVRFTCDQCQKSFSDSSALTRHVKSFHC